MKKFVLLVALGVAALAANPSQASADDPRVGRIVTILGHFDQRLDMIERQLRALDSRLTVLENRRGYGPTASQGYYPTWQSSPTYDPNAVPTDAPRSQFAPYPSYGQQPVMIILGR